MDAMRLYPNRLDPLLFHHTASPKSGMDIHNFLSARRGLEVKCDMAETTANGICIHNFPHTL